MENQETQITLVPNLQSAEVIQLPSVGRIVHFYPHHSDQSFNRNGCAFLPAIVTQTWGGLTVNIAAFTPLEGVKNYASVPHLLATVDTAPTYYWEWPPRV